MFNHSPFQWVQFLLFIIFVYRHCTSNMAPWSVKILSRVYTFLILDLIFLSFFFVLPDDIWSAWLPTSRVTIYLYVIFVLFTQRVLQNRTLHNHLVRYTWNGFFHWVYYDVNCILFYWVVPIDGVTYSQTKFVDGCL